MTIERRIYMYLYRKQDEPEFCCYCGKPIVWPLKRTTEHIIPKSKGGSEHSKNKRPCCHKCNGWRGNKSLQYWKAEIQELIDLKREKWTYTLHDLSIILMNIDYIEQAIVTATPDMFKKNFQP